jgi:hypothetical protein
MVVQELLAYLPDWITAYASPKASDTLPAILQVFVLCRDFLRHLLTVSTQPLSVRDDLFFSPFTCHVHIVVLI